jgi:ParB/RepB/Spo0J family partition protein
MNLGLKLIAESPTNPRKKFDEQKLAELAANVSQHGVLQALLVRPRWCVGIADRAELERLAGRGDLQATPFEIIAGARRFRAATEAKLDTVPCTVRLFTDSEAFDIQLIENLQRDDLTPVEEAQGYHDALELSINGQKVHTVASLAARVNKDADHIYRLLPLVDLDKEFRDALEEGHLPVTQASLIARVPDRSARLEFGREVLHGRGTNTPLTVREAEELRGRNYMRELKGAPFGQEDPTLCALTVAGQPDFERWSGRCSDCPYRSGNIPGFEGKRGDVCTNPGCFTLKATAAFDRVAAAAEAEGKIVLRTGDAARHFDPLGDLVFTTTLVRLGTKPREDQLKAEVKRAPTWAALRKTAIEAGLNVPIYVTRNPKTGIVEELIDSAPLIAAGKKIGEPIFRGGLEDEPLYIAKKPGEDEDDAFKRGQRDLQKKQEADAVKAAAEAKARRALALAGFEAVLEALSEQVTVDGYLFALEASFVDSAGPLGQRLVIELFDLKPDSGEFGLADCVSKWLSGLKPCNRAAACLMLLIAGQVAEDGIDNLALKGLAKSVGVDLAAVTKAEKKAAKPAKAPLKKSPAKASKPAKAKPAKKAGKKRGGK